MIPTLNGPLPSKCLNSFQLNGRLFSFSMATLIRDWPGAGGPGPRSVGAL